MKVVIPDPVWGIPAKYWDELRQLGAEIYDEKPADKADAIARTAAADIAVLNYVDADKDFIDACPNLKHIIAPAVGYNWIDVAHATSKGITVSNCPTFIPLAVAEQAWALLLALAKRLPEARDDMRQGEWLSNKYVSVELSGKTIGLIGYGNISKRLEVIGRAFGMQVQFVNSKSNAQALDDLLRTSDVVCLALPLNAHTQHLIDASKLQLMKPSALLINVARGPIVDQPALLQALKSGEIAGAGLDVFEGEPAAEGTISDEIMELVRLPNVVTTPHSSFNTPETLDRKGAEIVANIRACLADEPINLVQ